MGALAAIVLVATAPLGMVHALAFGSVALCAPTVSRVAPAAPRCRSPVCHASASAHSTILALLNQRAVQTQLYLLREFKQDYQRSWLDRFSVDQGCPRLFQTGSVLHTADAMIGVGEKDDFLLHMMRAPDEEHEVEVVWGNRIGGGSPNNPYLQPKKAAATYTDTVSPAKMARQLLSIRETLALEWADDLRMLELDNEELRRHHNEEVRSLVDEQERFQHAIAPEAGDSSPLRISNFDLLKTAASRCAVRRLYRELDRDAVQRHSAEWIRVFLEARGNPLTGNHGWHAAREFVLDLMAQPISVGTSPGGNMRFLDPLELAERVLDMRVDIATEWTEVLQQVPDSHLRLARLRLEEREGEEAGVHVRDWPKGESKGDEEF